MTPDEGPEYIRVGKTNGGSSPFVTLPPVPDVTCVQCGRKHGATSWHTCPHRPHASIDPQCLYADPQAAQPAEGHLVCEICRPIRELVARMLDEPRGTPW